MQQEPALTEDGFAILTGKYGGKLVAQSCLTPMVHTAIGGPGREFWVNDRNYPLVRSYVEGTALESGWGRVEMTPAAPARTHRLLTLMYAADTVGSPVKAAEIETEQLAGAAIFDCVTLFSKDGEPLHAPLPFSVTGESLQKYFLAGLTPGPWTVTVNGKPVCTAEVSAESGLLAFTAPAGAVALTPADR